jgi:hypothetical protein
MILAMMSDPPPGGNGTISRTGRVGQLCAVALTFPKARASATANISLLICPPIRGAATCSAEQPGELRSAM